MKDRKIYRGWCWRITFQFHSRVNFIIIRH